MTAKFVNIHPNAKIAEGVNIESFVTIHEDVVIGKGSKIYSNAVIMDGARIGENVTIFPGAVVSGTPQDLKFKGEITTTEIGNNTIIRECVTINRGTAAKRKTTIGNNCVLMAYSHVAHDCEIGNNVILVNNVQIAGEVEINDFAILGGSTNVHQFTRIGIHAFTQGGLLLTKDLPPFVKGGRFPASYAGINSVGLNRRGYTNEQINQIQDIYRILYAQGLNFTNALNKITEEIPNTDIKKLIVDFLKSSNRGVIPAPKKHTK